MSFSTKMMSAQKPAEYWNRQIKVKCDDGWTKVHYRVRSSKGEKDWHAYPHVPHLHSVTLGPKVDQSGRTYYEEEKATPAFSRRQAQQYDKSWADVANQPARARVDDEYVAEYADELLSDILG